MKQITCFFLLEAKIPDAVLCALVSTVLYVVPNLDGCFTVSKLFSGRQHHGVCWLPVFILRSTDEEYYSAYQIFTISSESSFLKNVLQT